MRPAERPGILVVTEVNLYREGIAYYLEASGEVDVLGTSQDGTMAIARARQLEPDVILLDMALEDSRATARALQVALPSAVIVALAVPDSDRHVADCAEAGITGYVPRNGSLQQLLGAILAAVQGEATCSPAVAAGLFRRVAELSSTLAGRPAPPPTAHLTSRESEVIKLIDDGLSNKQIAQRLCIELPTVKNHVHSILEKLGATSRTEAAARARRGS